MREPARAGPRRGCSRHRQATPLPPAGVEPHGARARSLLPWPGPRCLSYVFPRAGCTSKGLGHCGSDGLVTAAGSPQHVPRGAGRQRGAAGALTCSLYTFQRACSTLAAACLRPSRQGRGALASGSRPC